jgi:hypothetical protein
MKDEGKSTEFQKVTGEATGANKNDGYRKPMNPQLANGTVIREVSSWEGVSVHDHRFGGVEFRLGRRELGHLHGTFADLPFRRPLRDELVASGRASPHHVLPDSGWVTGSMRTTAEVENVIALFRQNYESKPSIRKPALAETRKT